MKCPRVLASALGEGCRLHAKSATYELQSSSAKIRVKTVAVASLGQIFSTDFIEPRRFREERPPPRASSLA
jgi:hypothetical protein